MDTPVKLPKQAGQLGFNLDLQDGQAQEQKQTDQGSSSSQQVDQKTSHADNNAQSQGTSSASNYNSQPTNGNRVDRTKNPKKSYNYGQPYNNNYQGRTQQTGRGQYGRGQGNNRSRLNFNSNYNGDSRKTNFRSNGQAGYGENNYGGGFPYNQSSVLYAPAQNQQAVINQIYNLCYNGQLVQCQLNDLHFFLDQFQSYLSALPQGPTQHDSAILSQLNQAIYNIQYQQQQYQYPQYQFGNGLPTAQFPQPKNYQAPPQPNNQQGSYSNNTQYSAAPPAQQTPPQPAPVTEATPPPPTAAILEIKNPNTGKPVFIPPKQRVQERAPESIKVEPEDKVNSQNVTTPSQGQGVSYSEVVKQVPTDSQQVQSVQEPQQPIQLEENKHKASIPPPQSDETVMKPEEKKPETVVAQDNLQDNKVPEAQQVEPKIEQQASSSSQPEESNGLRIQQQVSEKPQYNKVLKAAQEKQKQQEKTIKVQKQASLNKQGQAPTAVENSIVQENGISHQDNFLSQAPKTRSQEVTSSPQPQQPPPPQVSNQSQPRQQDQNSQPAVQENVVRPLSYAEKLKQSKLQELKKQASTSQTRPQQQQVQQKQPEGIQIKEPQPQEQQSVQNHQPQFNNSRQNSKDHNNQRNSDRGGYKNRDGRNFKNNRNSRNYDNNRSGSFNQNDRQQSQTYASTSTNYQRQFSQEARQQQQVQLPKPIETPQDQINVPQERKVTESAEQKQTIAQVLKSQEQQKREQQLEEQKLQQQRAAEQELEQKRRLEKQLQEEQMQQQLKLKQEQEAAQKLKEEELRLQQKAEEERLESERLEKEQKAMEAERDRVQKETQEREQKAAQEEADRKAREAEELREREAALQKKIEEEQLLIKQREEKERKLAEEAEEKRKQEEAQKLKEEQERAAQQELQKKQDAQKRQIEEQRLLEEQKQAEEQKRLEEQKRTEDQKLISEQQVVSDAQKVEQAQPIKYTIEELKQLNHEKGLTQQDERLCRRSNSILFDKKPEKPSFATRQQSQVGNDQWSVKKNIQADYGAQNNYLSSYQKQTSQNLMMNNHMYTAGSRGFQNPGKSYSQHIPYQAEPQKTSSTYLQRSKQDLNDHQEKQRQFKSILNKLTPTNFETLTEKLDGVLKQVTTKAVLIGFIDQIFEKSVVERNFTEMYSMLCNFINYSKSTPKVFEDLSPEEMEKPPNFRKLLIAKCQQEYENFIQTEDRILKEEISEEQAKDDPAETKIVEAAQQAQNNKSKQEKFLRRQEERQRVLGNIIFISWLYSKKLLSDNVIHDIIMKLQMKIVDLQQQAEDRTKAEQNVKVDYIECLCKLMTTCGSVLQEKENEKKKKNQIVYVDSYIERMENFKKDPTLEPRIKFMLQDIIELKERGWQVREIQKGAGPTTIEEIHKQAEKEAAATEQKNREQYQQYGYQGRGRGRGGYNQGRGSFQSQFSNRGFNQFQYQQQQQNMDQSRMQSANSRNMTLDKRDYAEPELDLMSLRPQTINRNASSRQSATVDRRDIEVDTVQQQQALQQQQQLLSQKPQTTISKEDLEKKLKGIAIQQIENEDQPDLLEDIKLISEMGVEIPKILQQTLFSLLNIKSQYAEKGCTIFQKLLTEIQQRDSTSPNFNSKLSQYIVDNLSELCSENRVATGYIGQIYGQQLIKDGFQIKDLYEQILAVDDLPDKEDGEINSLIEDDIAADLLVAIKRVMGDQFKQSTQDIDMVKLVPSFSQEEALQYLEQKQLL